MNPSLLSIVALLTSAFAAPAVQQKDRVYTFDSLLEGLVHLDWLAETPAPDERCIQFSSYDRASASGASKPDAWFANGDCGQYLRQEKNGGRDEWVMAECAGPGAIVRIWSANPAGDLRFYLDGESTPRWTIPFQDLCGGKKAPFLEPLCGVRSSGWNCYIPIPFEKSVKVTSSAGGFYYHVNVRQFGAGARTRTFDPELLTSEAVAKTAKRLLNHDGAAGGVGTTDKTEMTEMTGYKLAPGKFLEETIVGPCVVRRFACEPQSEDLTAALRATRVEITFDNESSPSVSVPLGDLFGTSPGWNTYGTYVSGVQANRIGYLRFPMPIQKSATVRITNEGEKPVKLHLEWIADHSTPVGALRFHAKYRQAFGVKTQPRTDYAIVETTGPGRFVGCSLSVRNPVRTWWGEGDEHAFVNGERFPSTFGTGTEDYFGYAWCDPALFQSAFHSQSRCDGPGNRGFTSVNRFHIGDSIPFQTSLRFDLEVWHWAETEVDYASVAYWYAAPSAVDKTPSLPPGAARLARPLPAVASKISGAIEAELLLTSARVNGGKLSVQDMAGFGDAWSRDEHLWWTGGKPGDKLDMPLDVKESGDYLLSAQFTKAPDYAIVALSLDGIAVGPRLDGYDKAVVATGELELGRVKLDAGSHTLTLTLVGANPEATPSHMAGLDYVRLRRPDVK